VLGALASWLAVRGAFRPMDAMVASARRIATAGDTGHRLPRRHGRRRDRRPERGDERDDRLPGSGHRPRARCPRTGSAPSCRPASHEIRTPLTVIRGYAEILGAANGDRNPQERPGPGTDRRGATQALQTSSSPDSLVLERRAAPRRLGTW
jgi:hypothetical protein